MDNKLEIILAAKDATGTAFDSVKSGITSLGKSIVSVNGVIAGFAGAAGLGMIVKSSVDAIAEIDRLSTMAGVSAKAFQELTFAANQYQISQDALTDGMKELSLRGDEFVKTGAGPAKEAFERLGFTTKSLNNMLGDTPGLLSNIISKMEGLDKAAQIRIADEIFGGTGGEQFVAMIQGGAKALDTMRKSAHDLGVVIDDDMVKQSVEAKKSVEQLSGVLSAQFTSIVADLAPDIAEIATSTTKWIKENKDLIEQGMDVVVGTISDGFDTLTTAIDKTSGAVKTLVEWNEKLTPDWWSKFIAAQYASGKDIKTLLTELQINADGTASIVKTVTKDINASTSGYTDWVNRLKSGSTDVANTVGRVGSVFKKNSNDAKKAAAELAQVLKAFEQDYNKATLTDYDYQVKQLDDLYAYYSKYVKDKSVLDEWYANAFFDIHDAQISKEVDAQEERIKEQKEAQREMLEIKREATEEVLAIEETLLEKEKEALEKQQEAYDELYEKVYGITRDVIDDWESMGDTLVDLAKEMIKDIEAAFLSKTIVIPVYMYASESLGLSSFISGGTESSSGTSSGLSISGLSDATSLYKATTGGMSTSVSNFLSSDTISSLGTSVFGDAWGGATTGAEYLLTSADGTMVSVSSGASGSSGIVGAVSDAVPSGIISSLAYTYLGDMLGLPQSDYSGITSGLGGAAGWAIGAEIGAETGSIVPVVGTVIGALAGGLLGSLFGEDEPDYRLGVVKGNDMSNFQGSNRVAASDSGYQYRLVTQDYDVKDSSAFIDYFDSVFEALDDVTTADINDILLNSQAGDYGRISWFDPSGGDTEASLTQLNNDLFKALQKGLVEDIGEGFDAGVFDYDFFEGIKGDEEALLDTYLGFRETVEALGSSEFLEQFTYQMEEFGLSAESAYTKVKTISDTVTSISDAVDTLADATTMSSLDDITDSWDTLIDALETARATTDQLTKAETARNEVLGANVTGLTASSIESQLISGGTIQGLLDTQKTAIASSMIAETIYTEYISSINEEAGRLFAESDYDVNILIEYLNGIDTTEAQKKIAELQESFGLLSESAIDATSELSEASRIVSLAINGQLSAAQQFAEWQIENAAALSLYTEMTASSVTKKELEGAIDAFVDLGLAGDDLNTVIQDLADRFTETTQQMYKNISDIESAQGDLIGSEESTEEYLNAIKEVVEFFKDTPSMAQIRGDESVTTSVFDEDGYQKAIANYVVKSEFENILGRSPASNYYQNKILEGSLSLDDVHDAIINGISNSEDRVNEIFNRLFGRSASSSYWADALEEGLVSLSNLESSILAGASEKDLAYYNANAGKVEITNWGDFESAAKLAGIDEEDYYRNVTKTMTGDFSTSEKEVSAALDQLEALPDVIDSSGNLISSALDEFIDVVGNMSAAVLEDIFGSDASSQIQAMVSAIDDYESAMSSASKTTSKTSDAVEELTEYLDEYLEYLQTEIDLRQEAFDDAKNVLQDYIDGEEALIKARKSAAESIDEYINSLKASSYAPVQSLDFFEKRYAQLLSEAQNADADGITDAISNLTSFTSEYLDFAGAYGGQDYNALFNSITGDLSSLGVDQLSAAEAQENELQEIKDLIEESGDTLFDLNAAVQEFKDAQESLNEAAWMQTELDTLSSIDDNISLLYAAASAYYDSIGQDLPDYAKPRGSGAGLLSDVTSASGIQLNDLIFNTLAAKIQQMMDNDTYSDLAASTAIFGFSSSFRNSMDMEDLLSTVGNYSDDYSFADGGIISGPASGYQMPNTTFHGTEAIIPLNGGAIPIEIKSGERNITVVVKVGNRELKDITTEIIRTDSEAQKQIRRVANG